MQAVPGRPIPVQPPKPYASKLDRSKSLDNFLDNEYTYIDPHFMQATPPSPRRRPPRPPPPRKISVPQNKPAITQRTLFSSAELNKKPVNQLGQRNSAPLAPTPKERSRWSKQ